MNILHLTIRKKWFDIIACGEKMEEYREIKPYWEKRLFKHVWDVVIFRNGYASNAPTMRIQVLEVITIDIGKPEWGAEPGKKYFVIKLGEKI